MRPVADPVDRLYAAPLDDFVAVRKDVVKELKAAGDDERAAEVGAYRKPSVLVWALNQAARELLLAQSSDWAFIMKTGTMVDYAVRRTREHVTRFLRLHDQVRSGHIDEPWLSHVEATNNIFPEIDYRVFRAA